MNKILLLGFISLLSMPQIIDAQVNILDSVETICFRSDNPPRNAHDGKEDTFYRFSSYYGCDFELKLYLIDSAQVAKIRIKAFNRGIKLGNYYITQEQDEEFYYVNPNWFSEIILTGNNGWGDQQIYEIEVISIPLDAAQLNYDYDLTGNMNSREIVIGSFKTAEIAGNDGSIMEETPEHEKIINDFIGEKAVSIYPNPTQGMLNCDVQNITDEDKLLIEVYSVSGILIHSGNIGVENIDLSQEEAGIYILNIKLNNDTKQWRIVKL